MTLDEAQEKVLRAAWTSKGGRCLCCNQYTKVYKRKITSNMAQLLVLAWRGYKRQWFNLPDFNEKNSSASPAACV